MKEINENMKKFILIMSIVIASIGYTDTYNKNIESDVPHLDVNYEVIFDKVKNVKTSEGIAYNEYRIMSPVTKIKWVNDILVKELSNAIFDGEKNVSDKEKLKEMISNKFDELNNENYENESAYNYTFGAAIVYLGQKGNIVSFKSISRNATLAGRDYGDVNYINIDINKKKKLKLKDIIINYKENDSRISRLLKENYDQGLEYEEKSRYTGNVPERFYFSDDGLAFEFATLELTDTFGDAGSVLIIPWKKINPLLYPEYRESEVSIFDRWWD